MGRRHILVSLEELQEFTARVGESVGMTISRALHTFGLYGRLTKRNPSFIKKTIKSPVCSLLQAMTKGTQRFGRRCFGQMRQKSHFLANKYGENLKLLISLDTASHGEAR
ncbi:hypothetical protein ATANTOWER_000474 [Ataeniobius toweri]|uniref:Transposase n=1 Tax=Ataeniobius toweri TaxID=208326 RepID=A0ABU7BCC8_9TELE|nr:hypothetical protein [Ataeniobius toweri]